MSDFCEEHEGQDEFTEGFCPYCRIAELEKENAALKEAIKISQDSGKPIPPCFVLKTHNA